MQTSEEALRSFYDAHRDEWVRVFVKGLQSANLTSYAAVPEHLLIPSVGKSMDLLLECLVARDPERYVNAQRDNFSQRIAAGVDVLDITGGLEVAAEVMDQLIRAALPSAEVPAMKQRSDRYLLMTRTTLLGLLSAKHRAR